MRSDLTVILPLLLLLWTDGAQAFSFCFSFGGGRDSERSHYYDYAPPLPGYLPGRYGGYPYNPVPSYSGYGGYYSLPAGGMPPVERAPLDWNSAAGGQ